MTVFNPTNRRKHCFCWALIICVALVFLCVCDRGNRNVFLVRSTAETDDILGSDTQFLLLRCKFMYIFIFTVSFTSETGGKNTDYNIGRHINENKCRQCLQNTDFDFDFHISLCGLFSLSGRGNTVLMFWLGFSTRTGWSGLGKHVLAQN